MIGDIFGIGELICKLLILMVAGIFKLVSGAYQIFLVLAKTNIFEQDTYAHLTDKVYIILAVTMLFVVAYTFITLIIDPDKNKGGKAVEDLIKKSVTSLILIVLCPTLFTLAFDLQDAIMDQDIIGKFFTSETSGEEETKKSVKQGGNLMAGTTFAAFFYPTFESTTTYELKNQSEGKHLKKDEYEIDCSKTGSCTLQEAIDYASATGTFSVFTAFAKNWLDGEQQKTSVDFNMLLALIAGFYLLWVIISFCFDLAIRVIKLAFYQVIAPICIACRMLPDKDSIFKNWWKAVCKTYLSIFIRVFIMNLAVFLMVELTKSNFWSNICNSEEMECGGVIKFLAFAFLVLGLVTFIKQASKLIDEIFGLGDVKLGITDKLKEGGGFAAASMARATAGGAIHGAGRNFQKWSEKSRKQKVGAILKTPFNAVGRGVSAGVRSLGKSTNSFGLSSWKSEMEKVKNNAGSSIEDADFAYLDAKDKISTAKEVLKNHKEFAELKNRRDALIKEITGIKTDKLYLQIKEQQQLAKELAEQQVRIADKLRERNDRLTKINDAITQLAQNDPERKKFEQEKKLITSEIQNLNNQKADVDSRKIEADRKVVDLSAEYQRKYNMTVDEATAIMEKSQKELKNIEEVLPNFKEEQLIQKYKTKFTQFATGLDQGKATKLLIEYNDEIKGASKKIISKYESSITVNAESSFKKNAILESKAADIASALSHKTVTEINGIANQLSLAQNEAAVRELLTKAGFTAGEVNSDNWTSLKEAFINVVREPYQKEVNNAVTDAITSGTGKYIDKDGVEYDVFGAKKGKVLEDLDSKVVRQKKYSYDVLHYELFGTAGPQVANERKDLEDAAKTANEATVQMQAGAKVMADVKTANKANNGK